MYAPSEETIIPSEGLIVSSEETCVPSEGTIPLRRAFETSGCRGNNVMGTGNCSMSIFFLKVPFVMGQERSFFPFLRVWGANSIILYKFAY